MSSTRAYTQLELMVDRQIHFLGIGTGVFGAILLMLMATADSSAKALSVLVYAFGLVTMLVCSAAYNLAVESRWQDLLRRLDHAAIFVMIAGTYTPFTINRLDGAWSIAMTGIVWAAALTGAVFKLYHPRRFEPVLVALYLLLGWIGLVALKPLLSTLDTATLVLLFVGGLFYSIGTAFHLWQKLPFQNAIWHGFVVAGAGCHYAAVLHGVV